MKAEHTILDINTQVLTLKCSLKLGLLTFYNYSCSFSLFLRCSKAGFFQGLKDIVSHSPKHWLTPMEPVWFSQGISCKRYLFSCTASAAGYSILMIWFPNLLLEQKHGEAEARRYCFHIFFPYRILHQFQRIDDLLLLFFYIHWNLTLLLIRAYL